MKVREGALARAQVDLDRCTIASPIDGIVISCSISVGQTVAASLQAPVLFAIANDLAKMQIDANVAEADVGNVEEGQEVEFTVDAFPFRPFRGKVTQVRNAPITVQNVVTYDTVIGVNNDDLKLKPGMTANASITIAKRENVLKIGNAALRFRMPEPDGAPVQSARPKPGEHRGGGHKGGKRTERTVYVLRDGKTEPEAVTIKTGITDGIFTEVLDGLAEGDKVVISALNSGKSSMPGTASPFGGPPRRF